MMKLGDFKEATYKDGTECKIWLVKDAETKQYLLTVFRACFGGWFTAFSGTLKEAREYARNTFDY